MSSNETVTISAAYFAELWRKVNYESVDSVKKIIEERDELKAKLAVDCRECVNRDEAKVLGGALAAAERCIEDIDRDLKSSLALDDEYSPAAKSALGIIRAYREAKEANNGK